MARRYLRNERSDNSLQATALVHEVYLRLVDVTKVEWRQRAQFFATAAQMMRRILVDAARARGSQKRGSGSPNVDIEETAVLSAGPDPSILAVDEALNAFSQLAPRQAKVVEPRYSGGLTKRGRGPEHLSARRIGRHRRPSRRLLRPGRRLRLH